MLRSEVTNKTEGAGTYLPRAVHSFAQSYSSDVLSCPSSFSPLCPLLPLPLQLTFTAALAHQRLSSVQQSCALERSLIYCECAKLGGSL